MYRIVPVRQIFKQLSCDTRPV